MCKQMSTLSIRGCVSKKPIWFIVGSEEGLSEQDYIESNPQIRGLRKSLIPRVFEVVGTACVN